MPIEWMIIIAILVGCVIWINFKVNQLANLKVYYPDGKTPHFTQVYLTKPCRHCGVAHPVGEGR